MPNLCLALQQLKHISGSGHAIAKCAPCNKTTIYFQNGNIGLKLFRNPCSELSTVPALQQTVYIHHPIRGHLWKIGIYENVWSIAIREIESSQFFNLVSSEVRGHIAVLGDQLSTAEVGIVHLQMCLFHSGNGFVCTTYNDRPPFRHHQGLGHSTQLGKRPRPCLRLRR